MSPFWAGLFENLRGRGRNAALFLVAMPCLVVSAFFAAQIPEEVYRHYFLPALPWVVLAGLVLAIRAFQRARARSRERLARYALSHDEMRKARTKLVRPQTPDCSKNSLVPPG